MGNVPKSQQIDQRAGTAEGHQWVFNTARKNNSTPGCVLQLAPEKNLFDDFLLRKSFEQKTITAIHVTKKL